MKSRFTLIELLVEAAIIATAVSENFIKAEEGAPDMISYRSDTVFVQGRPKKSK